MRVLLGLAALAATATTANAQFVTPNTNVGSTTSHVNGVTASAAIYMFVGTSTSSPLIGTAGTTIAPATNTGANPQVLLVNSGAQILATTNFQVTVPNSVNALTWTFTTNQYTAQMEYRWSPGFPTNFQGGTYLCDPCTNGGNITPNETICNINNGPGQAGFAAAGFPCASFTRQYTMTPLSVGVNFFSVQLFDVPVTGGYADTSSYSFTVTKASPAIIGDPQIAGMQGQDFQVHGMPDEIFNMITYPNLQVNARFVYLSSGACHDNFTACFAHPGTYISEEGIRLGSDKIHVSAGSFKKGLTVSVNGKKIVDKKTSVKLGSVEIVNHRRVVVKTPIMAITISNSDKFLNQETQLFDQKLLALGAERTLLGAGEAMHPEVPLHGLQGQTWRNVEYPSGLDYEGSISDYHVTSGNLYGTEFVFNQFKQ